MCIQALQIVPCFRIPDPPAGILNMRSLVGRAHSRESSGSAVACGTGTRRDFPGRAAPSGCCRSDVGHRDEYEQRGGRSRANRRWRSTRVSFGLDRRSVARDSNLVRDWSASQFLLRFDTYVDHAGWTNAVARVPGASNSSHMQSSEHLIGEVGLGRVKCASQ